MSFKGKVKLELLEVRKWRLLEAFTYITPDREETITAKRNFLTDIASIPKIFWSIIGGPLSGRYIRSAIIHDWLCFLARKGKYSFKKADIVFEQAMREEGATLLKRKVMYFGVKLFGLFRKKK